MLNQKINNIGKLAYKKLNRFVKDLETGIGKLLLHDAIIMDAYVDIVNGDTVIHGKNTIVDQGLAGILYIISGHSVTSGYLPSLSWQGTTTQGGTPPYNTYMLVGSDTIYGTTNIMTALKTPILSGGNPIKANTQSGANSNPSTGVWQVQWTATWNPGTVTGTLGEVGLYLYITPTLQPFQQSTSVSANLFSRMSSASPDNKFASFTINSTVPLSIVWTFRLTYAT